MNLITYILALPAPSDVLSPLSHQLAQQLPLPANESSALALLLGAKVDITHSLPLFKFLQQLQLSGVSHSPHHSFTSNYHTYKADEEANHWVIHNKV